MTERRFPPPWSVIEVAEAYCVVDATGFRIAYIYFDEYDRGTSATRLPKPEALRMANGLAKLPELMGATPR